jgi:histidyl-tRNA synthetase
MNNNLFIPKGCRDFTPEQVYKRDYIFYTLKQIFTLYGFVPIETPSMEQLSTLLGKYGEEGDKLLFKILNSGDFAKDVPDEEWNEKNSAKLSLKICEKGLRYDLTVPFARYVVMHRNEITLPFKRYQIQPVWRADRPQKGRYREFYQCDVDIIGNNSLMNEIELLMIIHDVFEALQLKYKTLINNRKILQGLAEQCNLSEYANTFFIILDKIDKIGLEQVIKELSNLPTSNKKLEELKNFITQFNQEKNNKNKTQIAQNFIKNDIGTEGLNEIKFLLDNTQNLDLYNNIEFDILLARGLSYYTGTIFEVKSTETTIGSICGGGRYDNLTGIFGMPNVSGVGMSFGADRIYDVMETLNRFPQNISKPIDLFIANFIKGYETQLMQIATELRKNNLRIELFPDSQIKLKKQLTIANQKKIPWTLIVGEEEIKNNLYLLKNMITGEQFLLNLNEIAKKIKSI